MAVLSGNTFLRPLVDWLNRRPLRAGVPEAVYQVHVIVPAEEVTAARDLLDEALERARLPIRTIDVLTEGEEQVELAATLIPTTVETEELDRVLAELETHAEIDSATWSASATL